MWEKETGFDICHKLRKKLIILCGEPITTAASEAQETSPLLESPSLSDLKSTHTA